ncbi:MAG: urate hydroxylase PuuD [Gammaproteobacteria bacterium]|nr:urate hydroxylase PuuD [Gammaproteobacteria bacterium]
MNSFISIELLLRWFHVLFGVTWIGLLYYFNFVQGEYFKEAEPGAKADATAKLAPRALWWFRWGAMFTFLTGLLLLEVIRHGHGWDSYIAVGALTGTFMFLNVWLIIWPAQKIVCGLAEGDKAAAAPRALLASRTNTLFSTLMLLGMLGSFHGTGQASYLITEGVSIGLVTVIALIVLLELNAIFGKLGPMATVRGVIHMSFLLALVSLLLMQFV